jgi:hypothetical protein
MILLAGVLLVLAYLLFNTQAAQYTQIGQQAGRDVRNSVLQDVPVIRRFISTTLQEELRSDTGATFPCPAAAPAPDLLLFANRAELLLRNIGVEEQNRGLDFQGQVIDGPDADTTAVTLAPPGLLVDVTFSLADGSTFYKDAVQFKFTCT